MVLKPALVVAQHTHILWTIKQHYKVILVVTYFTILNIWWLCFSLLATFLNLNWQQFEVVDGIFLYRLITDCKIAWNDKWYSPDLFLRHHFLFTPFPQLWHETKQKLNKTTYGGIGHSKRCNYFDALLDEIMVWCHFIHSHTITFRKNHMIMDSMHVRRIWVWHNINTQHFYIFVLEFCLNIYLKKNYNLEWEIQGMAKKYVSADICR
jgi:hypothetical protein